MRSHILLPKTLADNSFEKHLQELFPYDYWDK